MHPMSRLPPTARRRIRDRTARLQIIARHGRDGQREAG